MAIKTLKDLQQSADDYYRRQSAEIKKHMQRAHIYAYVRDYIVPSKGFRKAKSFREALVRLSSHPTFEAQVFGRAESLAKKNRQSSKHQRRKAAHNGLSVNNLIGQFATRRQFSGKKTKVLWPLFFAELQSQGFDVRKSKDGDAYEYAGKWKRIRISYRQFEKMVSKLAPRRVGRLKL